MKICTLSSGSTGNSTFLQSDNSKILIDCGLTAKLTISLLKTINVKPEELDAIFITHEHSDHIKGVGVMSRKYDIPILANEKTWEAMKNKIGKINPKNIFVFKSNSFFTFRDMDVQNISTYHDAVNPIFFIFYQRNQKISILTDTGIINSYIEDTVKNSDIIILESNHDINMLKTGPYPYHLKQRILGQQGHLSNDASADVMKNIVQGNGEKIILGHLSKTNNKESIAFENMKNKLKSIGLEVSKDIKLDIAKEYIVGELNDLGGDYK